MKITPLILILFLFACHKTNPTSDLGKPYSFPAGSEANSAYDGASAGLYKGVALNDLDDPLTVQLNIATKDRNPYCLEYQDGVLRDSLVRYASGSFNPTTPGGPQRDNSTVDPAKSFQGLFAAYNQPDWGNLSAMFNVNADGTNPALFVAFSGHNTTATVLKETSGRQVFCFVGTYIGSYPDSAHSTDSGRIALVYSGNTANLVLVSKGPNPEVLPYSTGTISTSIANSFTIHVVDTKVGGHDYVFTGYISGDLCFGNWQRPNTTAIGQFSIHRTL